MHVPRHISYIAVEAKGSYINANLIVDHFEEDILACWGSGILIKREKKIKRKLISH